MVYVLFDLPDPAEGPPRALTMGPYQIAEVTAEGVTVMDGYIPRALALPVPGGWQVHDGLGEDGPVYTSVRFSGVPLDEIEWPDLDDEDDEDEEA
jgi:hypothetical protein